MLSDRHLSVGVVDLDRQTSRRRQHVPGPHACGAAPALTRPASPSAGIMLAGGSPEHVSGSADRRLIADMFGAAPQGPRRHWMRPTSAGSKAVPRLTFAVDHVLGGSDDEVHLRGRPPGRVAKRTHSARR